MRKYKKKNINNVGMVLQKVLKQGRNMHDIISHACLMVISKGYGPLRAISSSFGLIKKLIPHMQT